MKSIAVLLSLLSSATFAYTGTGLGRPPLSPPIAQAMAGHYLKTLVDTGKVTKDWRQATYKSAEQKVINGRTDWIVSLENQKAKDPSKKVLYVHMNNDGVFLDAGHIRP